MLGLGAAAWFAVHSYLGGQLEEQNGRNTYLESEIATLEKQIDEIKKFRKFGSLTPGHPENFVTPGIETTTGPLGQGLASAVGMAIAERHLAAEYGDDIVNHSTFVLASDEDGAACEAFGVWVEKSLYGRKYMGIERSTFLIGPDGVLREEWRGIKVAGHVEDVLKAVQGLKREAA